MKINENVRGFSLIELLVIVVILSLIGLGFVALFNQRGKSQEEKREAAAAEAGAESAVEVLSNLPYDQLTVGGSFTLGADRSITITGACSPETCDWLIIPSPNTDSIARGFPYEVEVAPPSAKTVLLRRWLIEDVDVSLDLKRITVVVASDEENTTPLAIEQLIVGK